MSADELHQSTTPDTLTEKQLSMWTFIDQVMVKYGPLGLMLGATLYYIVTKDGVIAEKDKLLLEQQKSMLAITQSSTEALIKTSSSSERLSQSVDQNTSAMNRLVMIMERQGK
jgi:hypothetical protein